MRAKTILLLLIALLFTFVVSAQTRYPKREFRGAWIQCVNGQFQGMPTEKIQRLLINQLNSLQGAGINAIIFQVRAEADALYKSSYEPWSRFLTGVQGRVPSPYWDPMQFMIDECHKRGINVIIDFVMNHTSSQHEWFQTAYQYLQGLPKGAEPDASECPYVDYYNFSKEKLGGYYPVEGTDWYYEAQFWSEMPDLNWDNEMLKTEFEQIVQFWLDLGVDGFRLDAVKEFYSGADEKNIAVLTWFNDMVKSKKEEC